MPKKSRCSSTSVAHNKRKKAKKVRQNQFTALSVFHKPPQLPIIVPVPLHSLQADHPLHTLPCDLTIILDSSKWLLDDHLTAFLRLCVCQNQPALAFVSAQAITLSTNSLWLPSLKEYLNFLFPHVIESYPSVVYMPYCVNGNHWVLVVWNCRSGECLLLDGLYDDEKDYESLKLVFTNFVNLFTETLLMSQNQLSFNVVSDLLKQRDGSSCGAFVCWYSYAHANGLRFNSVPPNGHSVREFVFNLLRIKSFRTAKQSSPAVVVSKKARLAYLSVHIAFCLTTVMRQDSDHVFRDLLVRLHDGITTKSDWQLLSERGRVMNQTLKGAPFEHSLRLFAMQRDVQRHNFLKLKECSCQSNKHVICVFKAVHTRGGRTAETATSEDACGLEAFVALCVGARVMLTRNLWIERGLVNGSIGTVHGFAFSEDWKAPQLPLAVLINFESCTGPTLQPKNVVPIVPQTCSWTVGTTFCQRTQLPLRLCWATTIHKSQGLTLDKAVIHLGDRDFSSGLTYVALSRVRRLEDLCLHPVDFTRFQAIANAKGITDRKREEKRLKTLQPKR